MALLLCLDTATEIASVCLCSQTDIIASEVNTDQKNHAGFLQPAIQRAMQSSGYSFQQIEAIAVVNGPGSYTGLRVGLASAKGLCYALQKPLILLNTLYVMAHAAGNIFNDADALYCPMIDARRMEVFTAVYDFNLHPLQPPQALIISENSFENLLARQKVYFFGSGHNKCGNIIKHRNAIFVKVSYSVTDINKLSQVLYAQQQFANAAYAEPFYIKEFYTPGR